MSLKIEGGSSAAVARLETIDDALRERLRPIVSGAAERVERHAETTAPVRTGRYKKSIKRKLTESSTGVVAEVGAYPGGERSKGSRKSYYALWVEGGASRPAHEILPDVKRALRVRFKDKREGLFARVNHPGGKMPAQKIIGNAFNAERTRLLSEMRQAVEGL
jgi:HK97 gp10 family phage protein